VVLPHGGWKFFSGCGYTSFVFRAVVIRAIAATSMVRKFFIDTFTAISEYAVPV